MGFDLRNHLFAPGLSPGWEDSIYSLESRRGSTGLATFPRTRVHTVQGDLVNKKPRPHPGPPLGP